jgi:hypothetical protein
VELAPRGAAAGAEPAAAPRADDLLEPGGSDAARRASFRAGGSRFVVIRSLGTNYGFSSPVDYGPWLSLYSAGHFRFASVLDADADFERWLHANGADPGKWLRKSAPLHALDPAPAGEYARVYKRARLPPPPPPPSDELPPPPSPQPPRADRLVPALPKCTRVVYTPGGARFLGIRLSGDVWRFKSRVDYGHFLDAFRLEAFHSAREADAAFERVLLERGADPKAWLRDGAPAAAEEAPPDDTACEVCESAEEAASMLLCDGCDNGYHLACLQPPLAAVPEGEWRCPDCRSEGAAGGAGRGGAPASSSSSSSSSSAEAADEEFDNDDDCNEEDFADDYDDEESDER